MRRKKLHRGLKVEWLERRELMAGDLSPHQNHIASPDVNRDFSITALDALMVINSLNLEGARQLSSEFDPSTGAPLMDVSGDMHLTAQDALMVINALNLGEGVGETVQFKYEFFRTDGVTSLDPNPNDAVEEYQVGLGESFILRTSVRDLRPLPDTVFAAYHDIEYRNQDGAAAERIQLQWGEYQLLRIESTTVRGAGTGTFTLQFGSGATAETTPPISPVFTASGAIDRDPTAAAIQAAVGNLNFVGGASNVRVESIRRQDASDRTFFHFGISFINGRARQNVPDPTILNSTLVNNTSNPSQIDIRGKANPDVSTDDEVFLVGLNFNMNEPNGTAQTPRYSNGPEGSLKNPSAGLFEMDEVGGFSTITNSVGIDDPGRYFRVFEALFRANSAGTILFSGNAPDGRPNGQDILLLGENVPVPAANVLFPQSIPLRVVQNLQANNITFPATGTLLEDSGDTAIPVTVAFNRGTSFSLTAVTQPANGTVSFVANSQSVTFRPAPDFFGTTTFDYTVTNNLGDTSTATITVNVTGVNDAPTVVDNTWEVDEDPAAPLVLTPAQVFSPGPLEDAQTLTVTVAPIAGQTNGSVSNAGNQISYAPDANFSGTALFTVTATDSGSPALSTTTTVTVTVREINDAPIPFSGTLTTAEDTPLVLIGTGAASDILSQSRPGPATESSQTLTLVTIQNPSASGGTVSTAGGITTYTPAANFFGTDTITFEIRDNGTPNLSATGTITINVTPVNDAPDAVDDSGTGRFIAPGLINQAASLDVMRNDSPGPGETNDTIRIVAVGTPTQGGTVEIGPNGRTVTYTPPATRVNFEDTFTYTIEDQAGLRDQATATVFVIPPTLPFAVDDPVTVDEDSTGTTVDVLQNDLGNSNATKRLLRFTQPSNGVVTLVDNGTPGDLSDDQLRYVPNANVFAGDSFTYTMIDSAAGSAESTATVAITFNEINDAPSAIDRTVAGTEDTAQTIAGSTLVAGLSKGPLEDAQVLTVTAAIPLDNTGTVTVVNGDVRFTPNAEFNGVFRFTYTVQDNGTTRGQPAPLTATATVTVNVAGVNDAPIAGNDTASTAEDTETTIGFTTLTANDRPGPEAATDEAGQTLTVSLPKTMSERGGQLTLGAAGVVYKPPANFSGSDTFTYAVTDNGTPPESGLATVTINVTAVNDPPSPGALSRVAFRNLSRTYDLAPDIALIAPGPDNEAGQTVRLNRVFGAVNGAVLLNADGTVTFTPTANFTGAASFQYEVIDNGQTNGQNDPKTAVSTVNVEVRPFVPSDVSGTVWIDDNYDGIVGTTELRLGGVTVILTGRNIGETQDIKPITYTTLADGSYRFRDLPPGTYTVKLAALSLLIDGADHAGELGDKDSLANQFTIQIDPPGDVRASGYNFAMIGIEPRYANYIENLASSFYGQYPNLRQQGFYAALDAAGKPIWSVKMGGFDEGSFGNTVFGEVVLTDDGSQAIVTRVNANQVVETAMVPRGRVVKMKDAAGNTLVRVLASSSDLTWTPVSIAGPAAKSRFHLDSVEAVFAQEGWRT
jgi:hypothetical protein